MSRERGFSLLEVLVAFIIVAMVMAAMMQLFSGGIRNVGLSGDYSVAGNVADSVLARIGGDIPLVEGETAGEFGGRYRWKATIRRLDDGSENIAGQKAATVWSGVLLETLVHVEWGGRDGEPVRAFSLASARYTQQKP